MEHFADGTVCFQEVALVIPPMCIRKAQTEMGQPLSFLKDNPLINNIHMVVAHSLVVECMICF